ncbi:MULTISPECIES: hypothetical protein [unclassified Massilia]|uniref:hypothetical protein n=1 Tax=unclassified Massilia TaxID=2609279 RepID=UPI000B143217|nr:MULTISPECIES: hypothetical protein [unclassified Massilia]
MKNYSNEFIATLVGSAISGGIIYWLFDFNFWACAFFGYLITELVSTANKVESVGTELQINNYKLSELQKQNSQLSDQLWALQEQMESFQRNVERQQRY